MDSKNLTGIERELVLQYLIDGNVPVTLTPLEENTEKNEEKIHPVTSRIFPVAIKGEHIHVQKNGKIVLENPPQSVQDFKSKRVKVEFYFNRVGLFFESNVTQTQEGLCLEIPDELNRIVDVEEEHLYDFSAVVYFDFKSKKDLNKNCIPWPIVELFDRPVWKSIPLENQKKAKSVLEKLVENAKIEHNAGNGILLIPVCNYLTFNTESKLESLENRVKPLEILYIDHERIVFGSEKTDEFNENEEYGVKLIFSLKKGPVLSRDIFVTCIVNKIYTDEENKKCCIDMKYTTLQEEDMRFLYEKATRNLFI